MKKILYLSLAAALIIWGCSSSSESGVDATNNTAQTDLGGTDTGGGTTDSGSNEDTSGGPFANIKQALSVSLHGTTNGMRHWYMDGAYKAIGIKYDDLACKKCHIDVKNKGCSQCHDVDAKGNPKFTGKANNPETCFACHGREKLMKKLNAAHNESDVHFKAGKKCADCHSHAEIHGDGKSHDTYLEKGFFSVSCRKCHTGDNPVGPKLDMSKKEHAIHAGANSKLACQACHVKRELSCYNCHFNAETEHEKKVAYGPMTDFVLLVEHNGKITTGTMMDLVYVDKNNKVNVVEVTAPDMRHSISAKGRTCNDCHGNEAMQEYKKNGKINVVTWDDTNKKLIYHKGVFPFIKGALVRDHVIPKDPHAAPVCSDKGCKYIDWEKVPDDAKVIEHNIANPLSEDAIKALEEPKGND